MVSATLISKALKSFVHSDMYEYNIKGREMKIDTNVLAEIHMRKSMKW